MTANKENHSVLNRTNSFWRTALFASAAFSLTSPALAQDQVDAAQGAAAQEDETLTQDTIVVSGIRQSLASALTEKRVATNLKEVIKAEDIGKLPDQNLAEVLENITGIQITRTAGVGTGVQIRGTNANRVEVNGVSSVGSGSGRNGISFEDVNPAIIAAVEVTKAPEAKTIEGSVGGTVNLRTIRPLDLNDMLLSVRLQGEENSLSTEGITPRFSAAYGDKWAVGTGEIGLVITGSYTEQEAVSFRPRADRDNLSSAPGAQFDTYQGIQFLVQEQENDDYETLNLASTLEWAPNEELKFSFDAIINEQERSRDQYRLQASGISNLRNFAQNAPSAFETLDYSAVGAGSLPGALAGLVEPSIVDVGTDDSSDGNLRFTSETGSRITDSQIFSLGGEWSRDSWTIKAELSTSKSETSNPTFNSTLNFLNPNAPLITEVRFRNSQDFNINGVTGSDDRYYFALSPEQRAMVNADIDNHAAIIAGFEAQALAFTTGDGDVRSVTLLNDNATPFIYDLSGDSLAFGINFDSPFAPTMADLTNPANLVLDQVDIGRNTTENKEDAFRIDAKYDFPDIDFLQSVEFGFRYNKSSHVFEGIDDRIGGFSNLRDSPNGATFSSVLVTGPANFGDADGRDLFISNFLLVDPDASFSDPDGTLATIEAAVAAHDASPDVLSLSSDQNAFRDITEETNSVYGQLNFAAGIFRGNAGLRFIETEIESIGFGPEDASGARSLQATSGSYDFLLPRFNLVAEPREDILLRFGYGSDIRRPNFTSLSTGFTFDTSENAQVSLGNPGLEPEEVTSIDLSAEWYFAPAAVLSIGYFTKDRTNIFGSDFEGALLIDNGDGSFSRETNPSCPGGGVFNPDVIPNVLGDPNTTGLCVDFSRPGNDPVTTTQSGWELAAQYDLSSFEDSLGWASGFGIAANYTMQEFSGGSAVDTTSGRGLTVLGDVSIPRGLLDFSENAYNATLYYEKYGLSARARYTWREGFRTQDFGGGANTSGSSTLSFPVHTLDRGQLNASVNYDVTENFSVGVEATNLTEERIIQKCVTESGPTCFVGYPDRRIVFGGTYTF